jgi:hypothetical protein
VAEPGVVWCVFSSKHMWLIRGPSKDAYRQQRISDRKCNFVPPSRDFIDAATVDCLPQSLPRPFNPLRVPVWGESGTGLDGYGSEGLAIVCLLYELAETMYCSALDN